MKKLEGKICLVSGASSGFGVGIAKELINAGAKVYILSRNEKKIQLVATTIGAYPISADITSADDWDNVFKEINKNEGHLDVLINNAGAGGDIKPIDEQEDGQILKTISTNLTGSILGSKRASQIMKKQGSGTIINISSICSVQAWAGWSIYGAAKAGLEHFTRHLYVELRPFGVRATSLIPSWGNTDFAANANISPASLEIQKMSIQPKDIGEIVVNICCLPNYLVIPEMTLLPLIQEIQPY